MTTAAKIAKMHNGHYIPLYGNKPVTKWTYKTFDGARHALNNWYDNYCRINDLERKPLSFVTATEMPCGDCGHVNIVGKDDVTRCPECGRRFL